MEECIRTCQSNKRPHRRQRRQIGFADGYFMYVLWVCGGLFGGLCQRLLDLWKLYSGSYPYSHRSLIESGFNKSLGQAARKIALPAAGGQLSLFITGLVLQYFYESEHIFDGYISLDGMGRCKNISAAFAGF